jgi:hypothetical protein
MARAAAVGHCQAASVEREEAPDLPTSVPMRSGRTTPIKLDGKAGGTVGWDRTSDLRIHNPAL